MTSLSVSILLHTFYVTKYHLPVSAQPARKMAGRDIYITPTITQQVQELLKQFSAATVYERTFLVVPV